MTITDRMDFVVRGALSTVYYRSLHIVSLPNNIREVIGYAEEQSKGGDLGGTVHQPWDGIGLEVWAWDGIELGSDLTMDAWVFGFQFGPQTVLWRKGWWKGNFTRRNLSFILNQATNGTPLAEAAQRLQRQEDQGGGP